VVGLFALGPLWRGAIMTSTIAFVLALSLVVLTGFGGQTSLAQMAFAGVAGFALSKIVMQWGVPFPIAPILAALTATVFGVLVGLPALRVRGTNLAIITLAGGVAITEFVFKNPKYVGDPSTGGARVPNPKLGGWDLGLILGDQASRPIFGVLLVVVAVLLALGVANIRSSASGRRMLAARSNERAASAVGISVARVKLQVFAASSFIAGIGGCLIAYRFGSVSDASFGTIASLTALAVAYLGGITCVSGAVASGITAASGVAFYAMAQITGSLGQWESLIGGVLLILTAVLNPEGIAGGIRAKAQAARVTATAASSSPLVATA
jgi:branched-chain amino acid transport system permease protein